MNDITRKITLVIDSSVISELANLDILEKLIEYKKTVDAEILIPKVVKLELNNDNKIQEILNNLTSKGVFGIVNLPQRVVEELHFLYPSLGDGEIGVLAIARKLKKGSRTIVIPLVDDKQARRAAKELALNVHGTLWLLYEFVKRRTVKKSIALRIIRMLPKHGFRLSERLLHEVIRRIQEIC